MAMFVARFRLATVAGLLCGIARRWPAHERMFLDLAMLLLVASSLLLRSFRKMLETDPGFQRTREIAIRMALGASRKIVLLHIFALYLSARDSWGGLWRLIASVGLMNFLKRLLFGVKLWTARRLQALYIGWLVACADGLRRSTPCEYSEASSQGYRRDDSAELKQGASLSPSAFSLSIRENLRCSRFSFRQSE